MSFREKFWQVFSFDAEQKLKTVLEHPKRFIDADHDGFMVQQLAVLVTPSIDHQHDDADASSESGKAKEEKSDDDETGSGKQDNSGKDGTDSQEQDDPDNKGSKQSAKDSAQTSVQRYGQQSQAPLLSLPNDILLEIFDHLDTWNSFTLCLVSERLFAVGFSHLSIATTRKAIGSWAGTRIMTLGSNHRARGLPNNVITKEELERVCRPVLDDELPDWIARLKRTGLIPEEELPTWIDRIGAEPPSLHDMSSMRFEDADCKFGRHGAVFGLFHQKKGRVNSYGVRYSNGGHLVERDCMFPARIKRVPRAKTRLMADFILGKILLANFLPEDEHWNLRNLTTKEFVSGRKIWNSFHRPHKRKHRGPFYGISGLGTAATILTSWSDHHDERLGNGPWAGHRLEIRSEKEHALHSDETWRDVSIMGANALLKNFCLATSGSGYAEFPSEWDEED